MPMKEKKKKPFGPLSIFGLTVFCLSLASLPYNKDNIFTSRCTCDDCSLSHILTCGIRGCDIHTMIENEIQAVEMSSGGSKMEPGEEEREKQC